MTTADLDLGKEALSSAVAKFAMSAFGFVGVMIFARVLGSDGVGDYYFALSVALLLVRLSAGVGQAIQKRVSEVGTSPREYLGLGLAFHTVYLGGAGLIVAVVAPAVGFGGLDPVDVLGVVFVFGSVGFFQILNRFYAGLGNPGRSFWYDTVRSVLTLGLQLALLWVGMEAFGLLVGLAVASAATAVMVGLASGVRPKLPTRATVGRTREFAQWSIPTSLVDDLYKRADPILIGVLVGSSAVGFYETALRLVLPASQLAASISSPLEVKASGRSSIDEDVSDDLRNALTYAGLFGIPMFFGAMALPDALMRTFFGSDFNNVGPPLVGVAFFYMFHIYGLPLRSAIEGTDHPRLVFRVKLFGLFVHFPVAIALAEVYGLMGVIAATALAEVLMFGALQYIARDLFGGVMFPRPIVSQLVSGALMFAAVLWLKRMVALDSWVPVLALVGAGAAVYFAVLSVVSSHFRLTVRNVLGPVYQ